MSETLVFGGSFDPVHNGHVAMLAAATLQLGVTRTIVIPVGNAWQKSRMPYAPGRHRTAMLKLAMPQATIDDRELSRGGPTYSVDTMRELKRDYPNETFTWLLGGDAFSRLDTWQEPLALAALVGFAVVRRAGEAVVKPLTPVRYQIIDCDPAAISSTEIRALLSLRNQAAKADQPVATDADTDVIESARASVRQLVPQTVYDYIQHHQLYT